MLEIADLKGNEIILDIGTGAGIIAIGFAKVLQSGKVYGIDIYKNKYDSFKKFFINKIKINFFGNTLKNAQRNAKIEKVENKCKFISSNIINLKEFPDEFFDIILTSQSLYCIPNKNRKQMYQEINRTLKNGGKIIFFESRFFYQWNIKDLGNFFRNINYTVEILDSTGYKKHCFLYAIK